MDQNVLDLIHVAKELPDGGFVLVLNTGAIITPEAEAMLQALHSRSTGGIRAHLQMLAERGAGKFMGSFYVGYGHKSIGDCGTVTVFIEGVSMLDAKAIQDDQLYNGQEASTRYIDFSTQRFIDPVATEESRDVLEGWREFYLAAQEPTRVHLRKLFPRNEGEEEKQYEKAINARSFDILRGFLPAGASTNLAWHTTLRHAADRLMLLRHHPLTEVRATAVLIESTLKEAWPASFGHKRYGATEAYNCEWMEAGYYYAQPVALRHVPPLIGEVGKPRISRNSVDKQFLDATYGRYLSKRPPRTELPKQIAEVGTVQLEFSIDFGSFRDIQRQRSIIQRMPLLTTDLGMHPWYFDSLPPGEADRAVKLAAQQLQAVEKLDCSRGDAQYYYPMGMLVPCRDTGDLAAWTYIVELRAQSTVHPTLHEVALGISDLLLEEFSSYGLALHVDRNKGRFDVKRGLHDIVRKD